MCLKDLNGIGYGSRHLNQPSHHISLWVNPSSCTRSCFSFLPCPCCEFAGLWGYKLAIPPWKWQQERAQSIVETSVAHIYIFNFAIFLAEWFAWLADRSPEFWRWNICVALKKQGLCQCYQRKHWRGHSSKNLSNEHVKPCVVIVGWCCE
jgi:hypothetical protein